MARRRTLGTRQREILTWIAAQNARGVKPTRKEAADALGLGDTNLNEAVRTLMGLGRVETTSTRPEGLVALAQGGGG